MPIDIMTFLDNPLVSVCASVLSIIAAIFTFVQYRNSKAIKRELEAKFRIFAKIELRKSLTHIITEIIEKSNPKKLLIGGKLNKEVTQVLSEIRSSSIYNDPSISNEIKMSELALNSLDESKESMINLKDALCDLSRAIDKSIKE